PALTLMKGTMKTMLLSKLKLVVAVMLVLGALGAGGLAYVETQAQAQPPSPDEKPAHAWPRPPAAKPPTDLDVLGKEVELLRMRLQVVEAEVRALKGPGPGERRPSRPHQGGGSFFRDEKDLPNLPLRPKGKARAEQARVNAHLAGRK